MAGIDAPDDSIDVDATLVTAAFEEGPPQPGSIQWCRVAGSFPMIDDFAKEYLHSELREVREKAGRARRV
ncbi:hypothetical protein GCM10009609_57120 [Pseudonocardia aurantiaca]|uniref:Uncharacterized protein n=1 Tax=Pseudonocardia aurantiaca TaxID=75290 RepID=A0ABW4FUQ1_9PSEU